MFKGMRKQTGAMHVARIKSSHVDRGGRRREYQSVYLRRSYREAGKVKHQQLANLSVLPEQAVDAIEAVLAGQSLVPAGQAFTITRSIPHGHVAAVSAMARKLGLPGLLGPACRQRDLALALIYSRVCHPVSKRATRSFWNDATLGADLDVAGASTDEIYQAMDWLSGRQEQIEAALTRRHLAPDTDPSRMALFDLTSAWMEGTQCPLAARGHSRDGKRGKTQIEYGLLTDPDGRPVAVRVFDGSTGDPAAFTGIVDVVRKTFGLSDLVLVGDRGMITKARVQALQELNDDPDSDAAFGWVTALRAPTIAKFIRDGAIQQSLFDQQDLAEITHPDYPGERLIACRNPLLAAQRAHKRDDLLAATETQLAEIAARVQAGTLSGADKIGIATGKILNKYKVGKHFTTTITEHAFTYQRDQARITAEARLDGIYVIRTSVNAEQLDAPGTVAAYKNLAHVERDFRSIKADDLDLRPIYHHLEDRVRAHVLLCMLACYLTWHLRKAWAPLTFTDEHPPEHTDPVGPAHRSAAAETKASRGHDETGQPYRSFGDLLNHLATLTRNQIRFPDTSTEIPVLADPTPDQQRAFDLLGASIPLTLT